MKLKSIIIWVSLLIIAAFMIVEDIRDNAEMAELQHDFSLMVDHLESYSFAQAFLATMVLNKIIEGEMEDARQKCVSAMSGFYNEYGPVDDPEPDLEDSELHLLRAIHDLADKDPLLREQLE